jgi:predicted RND superfamily exporter protein
MSFLKTWRWPSLPLDRLARWMAHVISFRAPLVASFVVALGVFFIFHLPRLESKSDTDVFYVDSDPSFKLSRDLEKVFQRDEFFVVAVQSETLFTTPVLNMLTEVTASIRDIENVVDTLSLANVKDTVGEDDVFTVEPFILSVPTDASTLKELQARALAHPPLSRQPNFVGWENSRHRRLPSKSPRW